MSEIWYDDEALEEAVAALRRIATEDEERRKSTDSKLSTAQATIGLIVSLSGGSLALDFFESPRFDFWHGLVAVAFVCEVGFFISAARTLTAANDPVAYQRRTAAGVARLLRSGADKRALLEDEMNDLVSIAGHNEDVTNRRLTLYRASIENIWKGVVSAGAIPAIALLCYMLSTFFRPLLPDFLQEPPPTPAASARPATSGGCATLAPEKPSREGVAEGSALAS